MILIGQFDSPFVRRVGIALELYGLAYEHRPWSVFGDTERIRPLNPLVRVPTLQLGDGDVLTESHLILDYLDNLVPLDRRLFPTREPERHRALKVAALACGAAEQAVGLFYEQRLHQAVSDVFVERRRSQIRGTLAVLDADRAARRSAYWRGEAIGHEDIAVAAALRFIGDAHPGLVDMSAHPALAAHAERLEALPVFQKISQPFIAPA